MLEVELDIAFELKVLSDKIIQMDKNIDKIANIVERLVDDMEEHDEKISTFGKFKTKISTLFAASHTILIISISILAILI